jgi:hypothetical protein
MSWTLSLVLVARLAVTIERAVLARTLRSAGLYFSRLSAFVVVVVPAGMSLRCDGFASSPHFIAFASYIGMTLL